MSAFMYASVYSLLMMSNVCADLSLMSILCFSCLCYSSITLITNIMTTILLYGFSYYDDYY